jgi:hypothetical protein
MRCPMPRDVALLRLYIFFIRQKKELQMLIKFKQLDVQPGRGIFPNLPLQEVIPEYLQKCKIEGRNKTMKAFRNLVRNWNLT